MSVRGEEERLSFRLLPTHKLSFPNRRASQPASSRPPRSSTVRPQRRRLFTLSLVETATYPSSKCLAVDIIYCFQKPFVQLCMSLGWCGVGDVYHDRPTSWPHPYFCKLGPGRPPCVNAVALSAATEPTGERLHEFAPGAIVCRPFGRVVSMIVVL